MSENSCCKVDSSCLIKLTGHSGPVTSLAFSPDGKLLIAGSDNIAKIWNIESGECLKTLIHDKPIRISTLTSNSKYVITGPNNDRARIWDIETGECINILTSCVEHAIFFISDYTKSDLPFSSRGDFNVVSCDPGAPLIWYTAVKRCPDSIKKASVAVNCSIFSPDNKYLLVVYDDNIVKIWDIQAGDCTNTIMGSDGSVTSSSFNSTGKFVGIGYSSGEVVIYPTR